MKKILKVARREYIETVKTKTFLIGILLTPVLIAGIIFISTRVQKYSMQGPRPDKNIIIVNLAEEISDDIDKVFNQYNKMESQRKIVLKREKADFQNPGEQSEKLKESVRKGSFDGFLIIDKNVLEGDGRAYFYTKNMTDITFGPSVQRLVNDAVINERCRMNNVSPELISRLRRWVPVDQIDLSSKRETKRNEIAVIMVPFFFLILMFFGIFTISQGLLLSVIEEKTSRVIEVLLSAISPLQLMAGKILGQSAVGFSLISIYGIAAYVTAFYRGMEDIVNTGIVIYFIIYYFFGFLLISSMLAAVGSVCNTIKESQNLMGPIMILIITPMIVWLPITQHPDGTLAVVLSFIPPITPMVMILRIAVQPNIGWFQIAASIVLLIISVPVVMWMSAKIFRTGILMYGKPPTIKELLHWLLHN